MVPRLKVSAAPPSDSGAVGACATTARVVGEGVCLVVIGVVVGVVVARDAVVVDVLALEELMIIVVITETGASERLSQTGGALLEITVRVVNAAQGSCAIPAGNVSPCSRSWSTNQP
jgi:hypothetical protein